VNDDMEHAETTDEPDPAKLEEFRERQAASNGEGPVEPQEATYDIPAPRTPEEAERAAQAHPCLAAFLIVMEPNGHAWASNNIDLVLDPSRPADLGDMYRSCAEVMKDVQTTESAERTVQLLAQVWPQISAQQAENERQAKIAQRLMQKGIHVPGR
jgi:hypothetical protein